MPTFRSRGRMAAVPQCCHMLFHYCTTWKDPDVHIFYVPECYRHRCRIHTTSIPHVWIHTLCGRYYGHFAANHHLFSVTIHGRIHVQSSWFCLCGTGDASVCWFLYFSVCVCLCVCVCVCVLCFNSTLVFVVKPQFMKLLLNCLLIYFYRPWFMRLIVNFMQRKVPVLFFLTIFERAITHPAMKILAHPDLHTPSSHI